MELINVIDPAKNAMHVKPKINSERREIIRKDILASLRGSNLGLFNILFAEAKFIHPGDLDLEDPETASDKAKKLAERGLGSEKVKLSDLRDTIKYCIVVDGAEVAMVIPIVVGLVSIPTRAVAKDLINNGHDQNLITFNWNASPNKVENIIPPCPTTAQFTGGDLPP